jgi:hypothetical protein
MSSSKSDKKFYFFHYTRKSVKSCCIAIDTPDYANASDSQRGDLACAQCQWLCWPMISVVDIITLPYRGPKHLIMKCCGGKKNNKNKNKK